MQNRQLYILVTLIAAFLILAALGGGVFQQGEFYRLQWQHRLFESFCHQDPGRSFGLNGQPMAVCSRCFGIYTLFGAGWLLLPALRVTGGEFLSVAKTAVLSVVMLNLLDIVGNLLGFWQNTLYSRWAFGGLLGLAAVMLFVNEFSSLKKTKQKGNIDGTNGAVYRK